MKSTSKAAVFSALIFVAILMPAVLAIWPSRGQVGRSRPNLSRKKPQLTLPQSIDPDLAPGIRGQFRALALSDVQHDEGPKTNSPIKLQQSNVFFSIQTSQDKTKLDGASIKLQSLLEPTWPLPKFSKIVSPILHDYDESIQDFIYIMITRDLNDGQHIQYFKGQERFKIELANPMDPLEALMPLSLGYDHLSLQRRKILISSMKKIAKRDKINFITGKRLQKDGAERLGLQKTLPAKFGGLAVSLVRPSSFFFFWGNNPSEGIHIEEIKEKLVDWELLSFETHAAWEGHEKLLVVPFRNDYLRFGWKENLPASHLWRIKPGSADAFHSFLEVKPSQLSDLSLSWKDQKGSQSLGRTLEGSFFHLQNQKGSSWVYIGDFWVGKLTAFSSVTNVLKNRPPEIRTALCKNVPSELLKEYDQNAGAHQARGRLKGMRTLVKGEDNSLYVVSVAGWSKMFLVLRKLDSPEACVFKEWTHNGVKQASSFFLPTHFSANLKPLIKSNRKQKERAANE